MLKHGQKVSMEYTVFLDDGTQIDTNVGEDPLVFVIGQSQVFPALERALLGLEVGQQKRIILEPEDAYGPVIEDAFREVEIGAIPHQFRFAGAILGVQDPAGGIYPVRIHAVKQEKVVLDFNHPLAGKALRFEVKIVDAD